jgi:hypothetical protein
MKKIKFLGLATLFTFMVLLVSAQEFEQEKPLTAANTGLYAGGQASTNGLGLQLGYILGKRITLRSGLETMNLNKSFGFDENDISYNANLKYKTGGVFLMADYYYTTRLYFSAGGVMNSFHPNITGEAAGDLQYGDITIPASEVGEFTFSVEPSLKFSPYLGAGFRKFLGARERVVYNFETGFYYMGAPNIAIEATGLLAPTANPAHGKESYLESQFENYKIYPIVKFNLALRLF